MQRKVAKHGSEVPTMKRIGVIGGFGQWATMDILERILKASVACIPQYGNRGYPPMNIRMVNRAPMVLNGDGSFPDTLEPSPELLEAAQFVGYDADFVVCLAHTPHVFAREIEKAAGKPLLSIVDVTIDEVIKRQCKRVGIIAIGITLEKRLYQEPLEQQGMQPITLPKELSDKLDNEGIWAIQEGADAQDVKSVGYEAIVYLRNEKVDAIILACTELPILLGDTSNDPDIINPSQLLAEAAVLRALGEQRI